MIHKDKIMNNWLLHRYGIIVPESALPNNIIKALDQNKNWPNYVATLGKKEIQCYVGFIDLKGFSESVNGKNAQQIHDFVYPYLEDIISILTEHHCLIDKTIGDEIMFIMPFYDEINGYLNNIYLPLIFIKLNEYAHNNKHNYKFRIALSYGTHYLEQLGNENYKEWAIFGEPIIVAKRLMCLTELKNPSPVAFAIGLKDDIDKGNMPNLDIVFGNSLYILSNAQSLVTFQKQTILKGVGNVIYKIWPPNNN